MNNINSTQSFTFLSDLKKLVTDKNNNITFSNIDLIANVSSNLILYMNY